MSDLYSEVIVKRRKTAKDFLIKGALVALTVIGFAAFIIGLFGLLSMVVFIGIAALDYFVWPTLDVEYEYLYVNGEMDVDKIMSRQKRKKVFSCDVSKLELLAPSNSHELDYHKNNKSIQVLDFSSQEPDVKTYTMILATEKGTQMVIFEPNQTMLDDMKRIKPREVKLY